MGQQQGGSLIQLRDPDLFEGTSRCRSQASSPPSLQRFGVGGIRYITRHSVVRSFWDWKSRERFALSSNSASADGPHEGSLMTIKAAIGVGGGRVLHSSSGTSALFLLNLHWLANFYRKLVLDWQRTGKSTEPRTRRTVKHLMLSRDFAFFRIFLRCGFEHKLRLRCGLLCVLWRPREETSCRCCLSCLCSLAAHSVTTAVFHRDHIVTAFEESVALSKSHSRKNIRSGDLSPLSWLPALEIANKCACRVGWSWPRNKYSGY